MNNRRKNGNNQKKKINDNICITDFIILLLWHCNINRKLTILLLISWKCISQTLSTTSSEWKVTKPKPVKKVDLFDKYSILYYDMHSVYYGYVGCALILWLNNSKL